MMAITAILSVLVIQSSSFRVGFTFDGSWPGMSDEKNYADLLNEGGVDFELESICWTGGVEGVGDISNKMRLRGAVSVSRYRGAFEDELDVFGETLLGIFTAGLTFIFGAGGNDVIALEDRCVNVETACYYKLTNNLSAGGGPSLLMVSRTMDTPNTESSESTAGLGFNVGVRLDQESGGFLGLPIVFGLEGGYRYSSVELDGDDTGDFTVDFSGPYVKVGTYLKF